MKIKHILIYLILLTLVLSCSFMESGTSQLNFMIVDEATQQPIPGKLVFTKGENDQIDLNIPETFGLAPEENGFFTAFGKGEVSVPAGTYTIYASRGMEYSIDKKTVKLKKNTVVEQKWIIKREIDPTGYIGADLHMHTYNSDGHCNEQERVTGLIGEGIEFAVATDHNFVTDYDTAEQKLDVSNLIATCPGNELSTPIGHFNIYPLPVGTEPFNHKVHDGNVVMSYRDGLPSPVINQANHPRWDGIDYFGHLGVEPITSETTNPLFSWDFEAMEIMNETIGWGLLTGPGNKLSVWDDWFNMLNKDFRVTGVGNSDSHVLLSMPAGWPRNYIASATENPGELDSYALTENIIQHKVSVARGVFVNLLVNGQPIGSQVVDTDSAIDIHIEALAPSWVKVDKITLYGNAREVWSEEIEAQEGALKYSKDLQLKPEVDAWYLVKAEGSQSLSPIIPDQYEIPVTPVGFTNPVWVDIDKNGFEAERYRAKRFIQQYGNDAESFKSALSNADWWLQRQILALVPKDSDLEWVMINNFLSSDKQLARKFAYARIDEIADTSNIQLLKSIRTDIMDENERLLLDTYIAKMGRRSALMDFMFKRIINSEKPLRSEQCNILSMEQYPKEWQLIGPFENEGDAGLNIAYAPELKLGALESCVGKRDNDVHWQTQTTQADGFVDFTMITNDVDNSLGYAWGSIQTAESFKTVLFFGSDDGAAIWHNGKEIYRKLIRRGAHEYDECLPITLVKGENKFLVKVENRRGTWDFHFQLFDPLNKLTQ
ncbi:CehA/McbA family metallohydrolase [candidate division KSB1 bacterium]|nr:CehA/McbA family metallohydrolase [candidate division KSB1 bacterium]